MIKFFTKIRKSLGPIGKISAYLKYAIGEILLVVIGPDSYRDDCSSNQYLE